MTLIFYDLTNTKQLAQLELLEKDSYLTEKLNDTDRLTCSLIANNCINLPIGTRTTYNGADYFLLSEPQVTLINTQDYKIEADLESVGGLLKRAVLANPIDERIVFDYTAPPAEHLKMIVNSANKREIIQGIKWTAGDANVPTNDIHVKYDSLTIFQAIAALAGKLETEFRITDTTIAIGRLKDAKTAPVELSYGKDNGLLSGIERRQYNEEQAPTRLYVQGSERNMKGGRLTLRKNTFYKNKNGLLFEGIPSVKDPNDWFVSDKDGKSVRIYNDLQDIMQRKRTLYTDGTYQNDTIYPSRIGTISEVIKSGKNFYFTDTANTIDYSACTIPGQQPSIIFQSGNLAGREFDAVYLPGAKRFGIVAKEEDNTTLPNDTLCPQKGDKYIVLNINLPQEYIDSAADRLTRDAILHLIKLQEQRYSYKAQLDPVYVYAFADEVAIKLKVGRFVKISDPQIAIGDPYVQIASKRTFFDYRIPQEILLSNEVEHKSIFDEIAQSIDTVKEASGNAAVRITDVSKSLANKAGKDELAQYTPLAQYTNERNQITNSIEGKADKAQLNELGRSLSSAIDKKASKEDLTSLQEYTSYNVNYLKACDLSVADRKKFADLASSFNTLTIQREDAGGKKKEILQGLSLNNFIELSNSAGQVTAYIGGGGSKDAVLMAGITDNHDLTDPKPKEQVAIYQNGTGHFGNLYFGGDRIDFKERENDDPKLSILMKEAEFIEKLLRRSRYDHTENSPEEKITLDSNRKQFSFSITVPNDDTRLDIAIGHILCEVYSNTNESKGFRELRVLLDKEILGRWRGSISYSMIPNEFGGVGRLETNYTPTEARNLRYTRYVTSGTHTLSIVIYTAQNGADIGNNQALIENVSMRGFYDAGIQQSVISKSGARFFGGADRYIDVDYRIFPRGGGFNPYLLRVKGNILFDSLTLENPLDAPGCVLAGGEVDSNGQVTNSFGKYKNKVGAYSPQTDFDYNTKRYTIYHSIGNTKYIPIVTSRSSAWADLPRVMSVDRNSFTIAFINETNKVSDWRQPFIYTCYKAD